MNYQFPNSETFLNYLRGRLEGLAQTARIEMPDEIKDELNKIIGVVIKYSDGNQSPVE